MKTLLTAAILLATSAALAGGATVQRDVYACKSRAYFERSVQFAVQQDTTAFTRHLTDGLSSGQCVMLSKGEDVHLDDVVLLAGLKKVRRNGAATSYWTYSEAVR